MGTHIYYIGLYFTIYGAKCVVSLSAVIAALKTTEEFRSQLQMQVHFQWHFPQSFLVLFCCFPTPFPSQIEHAEKKERRWRKITRKKFAIQ